MIIGSAMSTMSQNKTSNTLWQLHYYDRGDYTARIEGKSWTKNILILENTIVFYKSNG